MDIKELQKMTIEGLSKTQIAKKTGLSRGGVSYWLKKYNIQIKDGRSTDRITKLIECRCNICNKKFFDSFASNRCSACYANLKRYKRKKRAIEYKGGKCQRCGYDKCLSSLVFHHRDPSKKEYTMSGSYTKPWAVVQLELDKVDLLCANCHGELHDEAILSTSFLRQYVHNNPSSMEDVEKNKVKKNKKKCKVCGEYFTPPKNNSRCCSLNCANIFKRKVKHPSAEELKIIVSKEGWEAAGRQFGVSGRSVRRWAHQMGIFESLKNPS